MAEPEPFVSRGGRKLDHALSTFSFDVTDLVCADLGASTGGFTDCLLHHGASRVVSVDTAYGIFAWKLRNDPRVTLLERTNALHAVPPEPVDLVVIDLGWTPQHLALPVARKWLKPGPDARIITLIKPQYEARPDQVQRGVVPDELAQQVVDSVLKTMPGMKLLVLDCVRSPIRGGKKKNAGNYEWLALLASES